MKVKEKLDLLFKNVRFDTSLYKKIVQNNIEFITRNDEYKNLFGSKLIGCHLLKYTMYDKNIFYSNLFNIETDVVIDAISEITSINKTFKIARDDVNLICFYIAHRFLDNTDLSYQKRLDYAEVILNYFSYRTLVLISSNYFIYPISEEKAVTLMEKLSNKYLIKRVKNWNEYCQYRSSEYLKSKYLGLLTKMNDDASLSNAITDLFGRTKDTIKSIYKDFIDMNENDNIISSKTSIVDDIEGNATIMDRLGNAESYYIKLESIVSDKSVFIKKEYIDVCIDIIGSVSYKQIEETLEYILEFMHKDRKNNDKIMTYFKDILSNCIEYLRANQIFIHKKANVLLMANTLVGNVLYARGENISINKVKEDGDKLLKEVFKFNKGYLPDRHTRNIRNMLYLYIVLRVLIV